MIMLVFIGIVTTLTILVKFSAQNVMLLSYLMVKFTVQLQNLYFDDELIIDELFCTLSRVNPVYSVSCILCVCVLFCFIYSQISIAASSMPPRPIINTR